MRGHICSANLVSVEKMRSRDNRFVVAEQTQYVTSHTSEGMMRFVFKWRRLKPINLERWQKDTGKYAY